MDELVKGGQGRSSDEVKASNFLFFYAFLAAATLVFFALLAGCSMDRLSPEDRVRKLNGSR